jgi:hypothetical protein
MLVYYTRVMFPAKQLHALKETKKKKIIDHIHLHPVEF